MLTGPKNGNPDEECGRARRDYVRHLVRIAREIAETRRTTAAPVRRDPKRPDRVAGRRANLEQAGLRGLMRVIGTEHPHLRATQIDMDEDTDGRAAGTATAGAVRGGRDRLAKRPVVHGAAEPRSAAPRGAANRRGRSRARRHAPADPHAR